jgi:hypothetical protein
MDGLDLELSRDIVRQISLGIELKWREAVAHEAEAITASVADVEILGPDLAKHRMKTTIHRQSSSRSLSPAPSIPIAHWDIV